MQDALIQHLILAAGAACHLTYMFFWQNPLSPNIKTTVRVFRLFGDPNREIPHSGLNKDRL